MQPTVTTVLSQKQSTTCLGTTAVCAGLVGKECVLCSYRHSPSQSFRFQAGISNIRCSVFFRRALGSDFLVFSVLSNVMSRRSVLDLPLWLPVIDNIQTNKQTRLFCALYLYSNHYVPDIPPVYMCMVFAFPSFMVLITFIFITI